MAAFQKGMCRLDAIWDPVQSVGMLWNRSNWFISTELSELKEVSIGDGRKSFFNLNFSGGLDRSMSPQAELSNIVCVCSNTVSLSRMTGQVLFKARASKNFKTKLDASKAEVEKAVGMAAIFKASMDQLATKPCNSKRAENILTGFLAPKGDDVELSTHLTNRVAELVTLHKTGIGNRGETEFDLFNAFTEAHTRGIAGSKRDAGKEFASGEYGGHADRKAEFARLLTTPPQLAVVEKRGQSLLMAN